MSKALEPCFICGHKHDPTKTEHVDKLWFSRFVDPEHWTPIQFFGYATCTCGTTLEQALQTYGTVMIRMSISDGKLTQAVICSDCMLELKL